MTIDHPCELKPETGFTFNLNSYVDLKRVQINRALNDILEDSPISSRLMNAMRYSVMAGGKRLRPILCLAATEAVAGNPEEVLKAACALELIHTYSLVHDDLPAMDNDNLRRGNPTCHIKFDEATAILAGDALLTLGFQILSSITVTSDHRASDLLDVLQAIAFAAGYQGMIEGQMRDMVSEGARLSLKELREMYALKTGALIEASVYAGAKLGNGSPHQIEQLKVYSKNIGMAFQITDDILNVQGNSLVMGKATGSDGARKKCTYPALLGIEESKVFAKELVQNALQALDCFDNRSDPLRAIARYIVERNR